MNTLRNSISAPLANKAGNVQDIEISKRMVSQLRETLLLKISSLSVFVH